MMRIGIMSDSHGAADQIEKAVKAVGDVECWLHAGDFYSDAEYLKLVTDKPVYGVIGNCDGFGSDGGSEQYIELANKKIWITHGHLYNVKRNCDLLKKTAREKAADIVIYGHTHICDITQDAGLLVINPGSVTRPVSGEMTSCAVLEIIRDKITVKHVEFK